MDNFEHTILEYADDVIFKTQENNYTHDCKSYGYTDAFLDDKDLHISCFIDIENDFQNKDEQIVVELKSNRISTPVLYKKVCHEFDRFMLTDAILDVYNKAIAL